MGIKYYVLVRAMLLNTIKKAKEGVYENIALYKAKADKEKRYCIYK